MPTYRFVELTVYSVLRFLPYLLLTCYVFKDHLRFSARGTGLGIALTTALRCVCGYVPYYNPDILSQPNPGILILAVLCLVFIKGHFGKSLFTMFMLVNISGFTQTTAKYMEGIFFPEYALQLHRWTNSLTLTIVSLLTLIPLLLYLKHIYIDSLQQDLNNAIWSGLWFIPFTLYAVWYRNSYFVSETYTEMSLTFIYMVYTAIISAGGMVTYYMIARLINELAENMRLREKEHILTLQHTQYRHLQERIEEARTAKHDMRQHLHLISAYLEDKKYNELEAYINRWQERLPENTAITYCDHYAVNALLKYFDALAKAHGIAFSAQVSLPADMNIPDDVLAVLIGNLLENAVEACTTEGKGRITVRGRLDEDAVFFKVVNTFSGKTKKTADGLYVSVKKKGRGIGLRSVRSIVEEYNGMLKIKHEDGLFSVSVLLNVPD